MIRFHVPRGPGGRPVFYGSPLHLSISSRVTGEQNPQDTIQPRRRLQPADGDELAQLHAEIRDLRAELQKRAPGPVTVDGTLVELLRVTLADLRAASSTPPAPAHTVALEAFRAGLMARGEADGRDVAEDDVPGWLKGFLAVLGHLGPAPGPAALPVPPPEPGLTANPRPAPDPSGNGKPAHAPPPPLQFRNPLLACIGSQLAGVQTRLGAETLDPGVIAEWLSDLVDQNPSACAAVDTPRGELIAELGAQLPRSGAYRGWWDEFFRALADLYENVPEEGPGAPAPGPA